ncbi:MAG: lysylphosphatidylglycerol synthase transmembrane domain-containing protein [Candidatus Nanohaloarchaea archaeon]|nr:lysylphosphatidylglycerol synthase transmembrane domain-containing protein [Candidatus Nanohaloarchaea archaeon]
MSSVVRRSLYRFIAAFIILGGFLYLIGWREVIDAFYRVSPFFALLGFGAGVISILFLALTWWVMLDLAGLPLSLPRLYQTFFGGTFMNNITPLGQLGGEPFIAYVVSQNGDISYEEAFAAIFSSDIINTAPFFTFSTVGLLFIFFSRYSRFAPLLAGFLAVVLAAMIAILALLWYSRSTAKDLLLSVASGIRWLHDRVPLDIDLIVKQLEHSRLESRIETFYETLDIVFQHPRSLLETLLISHASWLLSITALYAFLVAVGWPIPFYLVFFILPASFLASYIPLPGGLGGIEMFAYAMLVLIAGVSGPAASVAFILFRFSTFGVTVIVGGLALWSMSLDMEEIAASVEARTDLAITG